MTTDFQMKSLLCLPVNADEILASELVNFQFFVVDCRPAEQYNSGSVFVKTFLISVGHIALQDTCPELFTLTVA